MPRRKISEYRAKVIVHKALGLSYVGWSVSVDDLNSHLRTIDGYSSYVVKVDQAVKGRFKRGLVALDVPKPKLKAKLDEYIEQGYSHFIVEPYIQHKDGSERYLSLAYDRSGITLHASSMGGVNIEQQANSVKSYHLNDSLDWSEVEQHTMCSQDQIKALTDVFEKNHFVFLEINPYLVLDGGEMVILDVAVEVDDAAGFLVGEWADTDVRHVKNLAKQESIVRALDEASVASFNLSVINPQGSIFLLLSGGGASIVVADEIYNQGFGDRLANYGEYSGNPSLHETFKYTSQVLELLLASDASPKILFIGGAVANFTDIAVTFAGIIEALEVYAAKLKKHNVKVYVRRGGPNQEEGLEKMKIALEANGLLGAVNDASVPITKALSEALEGLRND